MAMIRNDGVEARRKRIAEVDRQIGNWLTIIKHKHHDLEPSLSYEQTIAKLQFNLGMREETIKEIIALLVKLNRYKLDRDDVLTFGEDWTDDQT